MLPNKHWSIIMPKSKITTNGMISQIIKVAGVSKENAINIFNIFGSAWRQDNIGLLQSLNTGINVKRTPAKTAKKVTRKPAVIAKTTTTKTSKKSSKKASGTKTVGKVKLKANSKKTKKLKKNKNLKVVPVTTTSASSTKTA